MKIYYAGNPAGWEGFGMKYKRKVELYIYIIILLAFVDFILSFIWRRRKLVLLLWRSLKAYENISFNLSK